MISGKFVNLLISIALTLPSRRVLRVPPVDIISIFWDADNQIAYGVASLDFQF
jgi:hypothetical protein